MKLIYITILILIFSACRTENNPKNEIEKIKEEMSMSLMEIREKQNPNNPLSSIPLIDIDCSKTDSLLADAYKTDQGVRQGIDYGIEDIDERNQQTIVSIIQKCGWPKTKENVDVIWIVLQHSNNGLIAHFYPKFKELEKAGLIRASALALMQDRLLMFNGYPQIFGSQVTNGKLYKLKYPEKINDIRESVGLEPIEAYTQRFGFDFDINDYQSQ